MALVASDLKDLMITDLLSITGEDTANTALNILEATISNYIMNNAVVSFAWNGIQPGDPPTPENTTPSGEIESLNIQLTPSMATTQVNALSHLNSEIIAGVTAATYNITEGGYSTTPLPLSSAPTIGSLAISINATTQQAAMLKLAQDIIAYITGLVPTAPVLGSHGVYTAPAGTGGTVTSIS